ncbi:hypothetical protein O6P43_023732 [Quillaja saponaria]|uniref:Uncharacterized protein n=1 Tax=Quillaja saponaria TaxID=32244 RepID=A0AAD7LFX4_QUISA|nr:hypothetical protein O6P43_023732 [Quillaja saponaria]
MRVALIVWVGTETSQARLRLLVHFLLLPSKTHDSHHKSIEAEKYLVGVLFWSSREDLKNGLYREFDDKIIFQNLNLEIKR